MHRRLLVYRLGKRLEHARSRGLIPLEALIVVDLLAAGRYLAAATGEIALRGDPVVIEVRVRVVNGGEADLRAVAGRDDRLVGFLGQPTRGVDAVDGRSPGPVDVHEVLAPTLDATHVEGHEVVTVRPRGRDHPAGLERLATLGLEAKARLEVRLVYWFRTRYAPEFELGTGGAGLLAAQLQVAPGVDSVGKTGIVLEAGVAREDRLATVDDERVESRAGGEDRSGEAGDAPADDTDVSHGSPLTRQCIEGCRRPQRRTGTGLGVRDPLGSSRVGTAKRCGSTPVMWLTQQYFEPNQ